MTDWKNSFFGVSCTCTCPLIHEIHVKQEIRKNNQQHRNAITFDLRIQNKILLPIFTSVYSYP